MTDGLDAAALSATALGLAMDAFAVALGLGLCSGERVLRRALRVGLHFGVFQAGMTIAGWALGWTTAGLVRSVGSLVAAGLLWLVAARMILEAARTNPSRRAGRAEAPSAPRVPALPAKEPECAAPRDPSGGWSLAALSVATSIDAFCAGAGLAYLGSGVLLPAAVIGGVAAVLPGLGVVAGRGLLRTSGGRASGLALVAGGLVLVGIGAKIALSGT